jgi:hypothetical protein
LDTAAKPPEALFNAYLSRELGDKLDFLNAFAGILEL